MTGGTYSKANSHGVVADHAFTILGAQMYGSKKVIKIRNPWGSEGYSGSLADSKMSVTVERSLKHVASNDGVFFMPLNEFTNAFEYIVTTFYDSWTRFALQTSWNRVVSVNTLSY